MVCGPLASQPGLPGRLCLVVVIDRTEFLSLAVARGLEPVTKPLKIFLFFEVLETALLGVPLPPVALPAVQVEPHVRLAEPCGPATALAPLPRDLPVEGRILILGGENDALQVLLLLHCPLEQPGIGLGQRPRPAGQGWAAGLPAALGHRWLPVRNKALDLSIPHGGPELSWEGSSELLLRLRFLSPMPPPSRLGLALLAPAVPLGVGWVVEDVDHPGLGLGLGLGDLADFGLPQLHSLLHFLLSHQLTLPGADHPKLDRRSRPRAPQLLHSIEPWVGPEILLQGVVRRIL